MLEELEAIKQDLIVILDQMHKQQEIINGLLEMLKK